MHSSTEQRWLYWLISPVAWASFSITIFIISFFFPPFTFERYIHEPYHGFLNWWSALYTTLCLVACVFGWWFFTRVAPPVRYEPRNQFEAYSPVTLVDLGVGMVLFMANLAFTYGIWKEGAFQQLANIGQSSEEAAAFFEEVIATADEKGLGSLLQLSGLIIPWFYWLRIQAIQSGSGTDRLVASGLFCAVFVSYLFPLMLLGKRNSVLIPCFGIFLVWFMSRVKYGKVNPVKFALILIVFGVSVFAMFFMVEVIRNGILAGEKDLSELWTRVIGYMIAPYNQQGAMIMGDLEFPGGGKGYYWTLWFWKIPVLQHFMDAEAILGTVPPYGVYERCDVLEANGFIPHFTALSIFANSFVDFGWFGIAPFLAYGFVGAFTWKRFREGTVDGIVLYTMFAYSVLEWRGNLLFPPPYFGVALIVLTALGMGRWILRTARFNHKRMYSSAARN
ncbi:MAG: hypothetical protein CMJ46_13050 [Planctomyces sp.]|nr:hypothetical protein [Planctomyces sp.]